MRPRDLRWLPVFLCNLLLLWLAGVANHSLSALHLPAVGFATVHLYLGGLLVVFPALRLDPRPGFAVTCLTALACDALNPAPYGTHLVLLGLVHAVLVHGRARFPRDEPVFGTVVALLGNLFLFLALSFVLISAHPRPAAAWPRLFLDLIASQVVLALITPWFLALQGGTADRLHRLVGAGRRTES